MWLQPLEQSLEGFLLRVTGQQFTGLPGNMSGPMRLRSSRVSTDGPVQEAVSSSGGEACLKGGSVR